MGMTIKEAIPILHDMYNYYNDVDVDAYIGFDKEDNNAIETALDTMRKYQQMQADYENRLKADMVAMLTDIQLEIDEIPIVTRHGVTGTVMTAQGMRKKIKENIQQKIDALKGEQA